MEFKQLEMLIAVAEERSIVRAADRVYRTQPAVSMALAKLAEEIGTDLFRRVGRKVELTAAGHVLADYARRLIELRDEAAAEFDRRRGVPWAQASASAS